MAGHILEQKQIREDARPEIGFVIMSHGKMGSSRFSLIFPGCRVMTGQVFKEPQAKQTHRRNECTNTMRRWRPARRRSFTTEEGVGTAGGPVPRCGAWAGGELTACQSVGTGEQSRAGSPGEHYHLLQDATYVGASRRVGYLGAWCSLGVSSTPST